MHFIQLKITCHEPYHITCPCKIKLDASTLSLANFTWLLGLSRKNRFLPTNFNHNADQIIVATTPLPGPSGADGISLKLEKLDTHQATYTKQAVCQSWDTSRKRFKSGPVDLQQYRDINKFTREGNNYRINAHIFHVF